MSFGLSDILASWQHYINDILYKYLNKFCITYLDDILIYSSNLRENKKYIQAVLAKLQKAGIQVNYQDSYPTLI